MTHRPVAAVAAALSAASLAHADPARAGPAYPAMAPLARYQMPRADEIALARSAAPPAIAAGAEVLVMNNNDYEVAAPGRNGFVCLVQRAWADSLTDPGFWNPRLRAPLCVNPEAARTVLPTYLERTRWVLAGVSRAGIEARTRAAIAAGRYPAPAAGAMSFMLSRGGYLGDDAGGPWRPHLMFFTPAAPGGAADWGANVPGAQVMGGVDPIEPIATYYVPVRRWSDGAPDEAAPPAAHPMAMTPAKPN